MVGSESSTYNTTHAGHPWVEHQSCSSARKQFSQEYALRASPRKASSASADFRSCRRCEATCVAYLWILNRGAKIAWRMSRCSRKADNSSGEHDCWWKGQKLQSVSIFQRRRGGVAFLKHTSVYPSPAQFVRDVGARP